MSDQMSHFYKTLHGKPLQATCTGICTTYGTHMLSINISE